MEMVSITFCGSGIYTACVLLRLTSVRASTCSSPSAMNRATLHLVLRVPDVVVNPTLEDRLAPKTDSQLNTAKVLGQDVLASSEENKGLLV